jgi:hypothetical protein
MADLKAFAEGLQVISRPPARSRKLPSDTSTGKKKDYLKIPVHEQVEVLSVVGDIAINKGKPNIHVHVVLGKRDGTTCGGTPDRGRSASNSRGHSHRVAPPPDPSIRSRIRTCSNFIRR